MNGSASQEGADDDGDNDEIEIIEDAPPPLKRRRADDESPSSANNERSVECVIIIRQPTIKIMSTFWFFLSLKLHCSTEWVTEINRY